MAIYACKSDVFKGDIIKADGIYYVVIDNMNTNNGNFRAKDSKGRLVWLHTMHIDRVIKRKNTETIYI